MIFSEEQKKELLSSIELQGSIAEEYCKANNLVLGSRKNINHIGNNSGGRWKIYPSKRKDFSLILEQPKALAPLHWSQIRCVLCTKIIANYPCWYYRKDYDVNKFHFFVCFDASHPDKPTELCYRSDSMIQRELERREEQDLEKKNLRLYSGNK